MVLLGFRCLPLEHFAKTSAALTSRVRLIAGAAAAFPSFRAQNAGFHWSHGPRSQRNDLIIFERPSRLPFKHRNLFAITRRHLIFRRFFFPCKIIFHEKTRFFVLSLILHVKKYIVQRDQWIMHLLQSLRIQRATKIQRRSFIAIPKMAREKRNVSR